MNRAAPTLGEIVRTYKAVSTRMIRQTANAKQNRRRISNSHPRIYSEKPIQVGNRSRKPGRFESGGRESLDAIPNQTHPMPKPHRWLISERADFWLASAGASGGLLAALALIVLYGDREIDWLDLVLSELHLGATYDSIARRRLWRRLPVDVLVVPLAILAATYVLAFNSQWTLLTSIAMYAAVWHRGRQSLGIARFYQCNAGGPLSPLHNWLFAGAIYLPMVAAIFLYGHLARTMRSALARTLAGDWA